ncbi:hypothetical protein TL18_01210 [Methanobrevibacter sp. YE315]|uniref:hypothetical protein n=1 Tax=Methanobrevibacter sp. YE315 TaxID=1609968 RepID=UPI000764E3E7|nr:hypothetical protein [Methanobrevibacter sp. YE315]AMD16778.1 hypothetical protein TL18_01210 [Methanobrevibacter sp. YE315]
MNSKTIIIAAIAVILLVLGGIVIAQNTTPKENVTAYDVNLKNADFKYFDIKVPEGSNFTIKNIMNESDKGMVYWKNSGNYTKEVEGIIINKNMTDKLIPISMDLINKNGTEKVYHSNGGYQIVKTINNTDLILIGSDLHVLNEMIDSVKIKNTDNITSPKAKENTTPVKKVIKTVEKPKPKPEPKKTEDTRKKTSGQIYIGGGIFKTGSGLDDKTNAKIYIDGGHPGESIIIKIKYYRDGNSLNVGNMVTATIGDDGYVNINSADAYTHYPDKAYIELYDLDGNLQCTQTVTLNPDSSTQFF